MRRTARFIALASYAYLAAIIGACVLIRAAGDYWWPATVLLLGPRWIFALPLPVLAVASILTDRRLLLINSISAFVLIVWLMGFSVSLAPLHRTSGAPGLRVMTCNIHAGAGRIDLLRAQVLLQRPDILALEEWPYGHKPNSQVMPDWNVMTDGELHTESRYPIAYRGRIFGEAVDQAGAASEFSVQAPGGAFTLISVHFKSPHHALFCLTHLYSSGIALLEDDSRVHQREAAAVSAAARAAGGDVIVLGDFNMPVDCPVYQMNFGRFDNAFSSAGFGFGWSYYWQGTAVRIDQILTSAHWRCTGCWLAPGVGSPHYPLVADLTRR